MERLRRFLLSLSLIFASTALYAQTEISGTVLDDFGEGVIGATVMEKGTSNGTVTDLLQICSDLLEAKSRSLSDVLHQ